MEPSLARQTAFSVFLCGGEKRVWTSSDALFILSIPENLVIDVNVLNAL